MLPTTYGRAYLESITIARIGTAKFISTIWKAASLPARALKTLATATTDCSMMAGSSSSVTC
jgi:hypothetical protein